MISEYLLHGSHFSRDWHIMVANKLSTRFRPFGTLYSTMKTQIRKIAVISMKKTKQGKRRVNEWWLEGFSTTQVHQQEVDAEMAFIAARKLDPQPLPFGGERHKQIPGFQLSSSWEVQMEHIPGHSQNAPKMQLVN